MTQAGLAEVYENTRILDSTLAEEEAYKIQEGFLEAEQLGIGDRASQKIFVHDRHYMIGEALAKCDEFGQSIRDMVEAMSAVGASEEQKREFVSKKIDEKIEEAKSIPVPKEIIDREAEVRASNEKKN